VQGWRSLGLALALALCLSGARAAAPGAVRGHVLDTAGEALVGATVTVTDLSNGAVVHAVADATGAYAVAGLAAHKFRVEVAKSGFATFTRQVTLAQGQTLTLDARLAPQAVVQTVMVRGDEVKGATKTLSEADIFKSTQSIRVLNREQITALSPVAGSAQILSIAPGANVTGYGNTGATKSTITLNGIQQGWGGYGGYTTSGALGITFDGIPVADPATGLWQSNMFPQSSLINATSLTYGPGDPAERWYTNVGGGVEFTPLQPSRHMHGSISQVLGNYGEENTAFEFTTGTYRGWSAVLAGGHGSGDSFRASPDGFTSPTHDEAFYGKTIKAFADGDFQFGGYYSSSAGYRPQVIPVAAAPGVAMGGAGGGAIYSQASSGFYSTVPQADYSKYDTNQMALFWAKLHLSLDPTTSLENDVWSERINRIHDRTADVFAPNALAQEMNNPYTRSFGDRIEMQKVADGNTITFGGYYLHALYNSRANFYNSALGGGVATVNVGGKVRSSYFDQDMYTVFAQDAIRPFAWLTVTPGLRYVNNQIGYANGILHDFQFAPGVVIPTSCVLNGQVTSTPGNITVQDANCASSLGRSGYEPSLDVAIQPTAWLSVYGGFQEQLKSPQLGGGGGPFQAVDPATYHLARAQYTQAGVKAHFAQVGPAANVLAGAAYFHLNYGDQELDVGLANGYALAAIASSSYNGVNAFVDADATSALHVFMNATVERAKYISYNNLNGAVFSGLQVPYVPQSALNLGAYYTITALNENVVIQPRIWYQYTGSQTVFDNLASRPSATAMPNFGTLNLGANIPIRWFNLRLTALNITNRKYNQYEYISSGGYFGTASGGYLLAYPGAPFTFYTTLSAHF
jgi:iron complex outermembrane receptor protein